MIPFILIFRIGILKEKESRLMVMGNCDGGLETR
jgi:hypothetical protein